MTDHAPHRQPHPPLPDRIEEYDQDFWDDRYRSRPALWSGRPNTHLVEQAGGLEPGRALDLGCGEGADALWLATRGWSVIAVDISAVALERARGAAAEAGPEVADAITWLPVDLLAWTPPPAAFDLVSAQFVHFPATERPRIFGSWAAAVAPGGSLLVVGHHPSDPQATERPAHLTDLLFAGGEVAAVLDPELWDVVVDSDELRVVASPGGEETPRRDAVFRAVRRG